jgi:hypothetical protein
VSLVTAATLARLAGARSHSGTTPLGGAALTRGRRDVN